VTRWSAKFHMAERFLKLRPHLLQVASAADSTLDFNASNTFTRNVTKVTGWLGEMDAVTKEMQTHCITLAQCTDLLADLQKTIDKNKRLGATVNGRPNVYKGCPFKLKKCLSSYEPLCPEPNFINGVVKIQKGDWRALTAAEQQACVGLLKVNVFSAGSAAVDDDNSDGSSGDDDDDTSPLGMKARIRRLKEQSSGKDLACPYVNCDFIYGSAAKVEWLWSLAKYILTSQRSSMTPLMFETLLFLKANRRFWDKTLVVEAIQMAKSARVQKKAEDEQAQGQIVEDLTTDDEDDD